MCSMSNNDQQAIFRKEIEAAVKYLKINRSAGIDNIPVEQIQATGEAMIAALHRICHNVWQIGGWHMAWTQSLVITLPEK